MRPSRDSAPSDAVHLIEDVVEMGLAGLDGGQGWIAGLARGGKPRELSEARPVIGLQCQEPR